MRAMGMMSFTFRVQETIDRILKNLLLTSELATIIFGLVHIDKHW